VKNGFLAKGFLNPVPAGQSKTSDGELPRLPLYTSTNTTLLSIV